MNLMPQWTVDKAFAAAEEAAGGPMYPPDVTDEVPRIPVLTIRQVIGDTAISR